MNLFPLSPRASWLLVGGLTFWALACFYALTDIVRLVP